MNAAAKSRRSVGRQAEADDICGGIRTSPLLANAGTIRASIHTRSLDWSQSKSHRPPEEKIDITLTGCGASITQIGRSQRTVEGDK